MHGAIRSGPRRRAGLPALGDGAAAVDAARHRRRHPAARQAAASPLLDYGVGLARARRAHRARRQHGRAAGRLHSGRRIRPLTSASCEARCSRAKTTSCAGACRPPGFARALLPGAPRRVTGYPPNACARLYFLSLVLLVGHHARDARHEPPRSTRRSIYGVPLYLVGTCRHRASASALAAARASATGFRRSTAPSTSRSPWATPPSVGPGRPRSRGAPRWPGGRVNVSSVSDPDLHLQPRARSCARRSPPCRPSTRPRDCAVEIVVVDNNSTDETPASHRGRGTRASPMPLRRFRNAAGQELRPQRGLAARDRRRARADRRRRAAVPPDWLARIVARLPRARRHVRVRQGAAALEPRAAAGAADAAGTGDLGTARDRRLRRRRRPTTRPRSTGQRLPDRRQPGRSARAPLVRSADGGPTSAK